MAPNLFDDRNARTPGSPRTPLYLLLYGLTLADFDSVDKIVDNRDYG